MPLFSFLGADTAKAEGLAPEFLEKPRIIPKEGGKLIVMQCKVKAKPAPKITWYQGTKLVKETNRVQSKVIEGAGDEFTVSLEVRVRIKIFIVPFLFYGHYN